MNTEELLAMTRFSRRTMLKAAGVGAAGFTLEQTNFLRAEAKTSQRLQDVLDITATIERFGVTFNGEGLRANKDKKFDKAWPDEVVAVVTAVRAQEHYHLDAWQKAGGRPLYKSFTVPADYLTNFNKFFAAVVAEEAAETAAQIAAMKVFTELQRPDLVKLSFQYAAEESEHRVLANYVLGTRPPNDNAFAPAMFNTVDDFLVYWKKNGIIGGKGTKITYPGPGSIDSTNVTNKTPGGTAVSCTFPSAAATPAGPSSSDGTTPAAGATPVS